MTVKKQQATADKSYDIQTNIMLQQVRAEEVTVRQVEKEHEVKVQDAEVLRRDRELPRRPSSRPLNTSKNEL